MSASLILSILSLYTGGILFILTGITALKKFKKDLAERTFGYAMILLGTEFGLIMGTRTIFGALGYHNIDLSIYYFGQIVCAMLFVFGLFSEFHKAFGFKVAKIAGVFLVIINLFFIGFHFTEGHTGPHISKWGTEYGPVGRAKILFLLIFGTFIIMLFYLLSSQLIRWLKTKTVSYEFYVWVSFLLVLFAAVFEEMGEMTTWKLVFCRIVFNGVAIAMFLLYTHESVREEIKDEIKEEIKE